jgi:hypothetical protein
MMKPATETRPRFREPPIPPITGLDPASRMALTRDLGAAQARLERAFKTATHRREHALAKRISDIMRPIGEEIVRLNGGPVLTIGELLG